MSTIRTNIITVTNVRPHPNADALDLAECLGWQMVIKKGSQKDGDHVVYFEAGTTIPAELAERLGVTNYLKNKLDINGERVLVIGHTRLRGEPSFGLIVPVQVAYDELQAQNPGALIDARFPLGTDVADIFGAAKFMPPVKTSAGDADVDHPQFHAYTDIENMRSYPDVFVEGEEVEASEKLHGTNSRVGFVAGDTGVPSLVENPEQRELLWLAGSRTLRRKQPLPEHMSANTYWRPLTVPAVKDLLEALYMQGHKQAVLYGEVFGKGVQNYDYGTNMPLYRAFDLMIDGKYADREMFYKLCEAYSVETCPVLYRGPYSLAAIKAVSDGESKVGGTKGREGVVVRPLVERTNPKTGRTILKYVGDVYLFSSKGGAAEDFTDQ